MASQNSGLKAFQAAEDIGAYVRVKLDSSGYIAIAGDDDGWIGTTEAEGDSGHFITVRLRNVPGTRKMVAGGAITALNRVYGAASGRVDDLATGGFGVGLALTAAAAAGEIVEVLTDSAAGEAEGLLAAIVADSDNHTNTTTETAFSNGTKTIGGGDLKVGDVFRVRALVNVPSTNATDTLTIKLYFGTEEIASTGALDVANDAIAYIDAEIVVRAVGASGAVAAAGLTMIGAAGTQNPKPFRKAQATEDLSGDVAIAVKATWSVAHADNDCDLEHFTVQLLRQ
jgi:hypothetical protein